MADGSVAIGDPALAARLKSALRGEVLFDAGSRGRYSTDASIYQIEPIGVIVPEEIGDVAAALAIAREAGVPVLARGGGTSQCGQTVGRALVLDCSRYMSRLVSVDKTNRRARVQPGLVLDQLNKVLRGDKLFFPVDVSTGNRATLGGMAANNSCGARSIRYGNMVHNVRAIDAILADGTAVAMGEVPGNFNESAMPERYRELVRQMRTLHNREADEIERRFPKLLRRVGGYNIDMVSDQGHNMAHLLVGSEGTLAFFSEIELDLQPIPAHRVLGICHFPTFYKAMASTKAIVALEPTAVELVDRTMVELAREIAMFRPTVDRFVKGEPDALLLVEFAGDDADANNRGLRRLVELMGDLGFPDAVVEATDPAFQSAVWEVRKQGLNIMMSMKGDGKPISFIEDCAVSLDDLADYTDRLTNIFKKHGTYGTFYAHASVGCLHVRPVLNLKQDIEVKKMRAIAEEAFAMVREYKGSHSGEHGDGLVRSEFHEPMFGTRLVRAFEEVKDRFDPSGLFNPGKIVRAPKFDDRANFRYGPGYHGEPMQARLDWSAYPGVGGGFQGAVEMCNNNGACRALAGGVMCPSYRVTRDERDVTRGRANTLRLAISGQLGPAAFVSDEMAETMKLCVSCKACRRECPTGVDMARMKIEVQAARAAKHGLSLHDRMVAYLPRYAPLAARLAFLFNLRDVLPGAAALSERVAGFSARRSLPRWRGDWFRDPSPSPLVGEGRGGGSGGYGTEVPHSPTPTPDPSPQGGGEQNRRDVVLFADTFNRYFEPENLHAAARVLSAGGYQVHVAAPTNGSSRPLCCGRTFLAVGRVEEARREAERSLAALEPYVARGVPVVGLEPSCLFSFRDEIPAMMKGDKATRVAAQALLFEEFLGSEAAAGR